METRFTLNSPGTPPVRVTLIPRPHGAAVEPSRSFCKGRYNGPVAELCEPVYRRRTGLRHEVLDRLSSSCRSGRGRAAPRRVMEGLTAGSHALTCPHPGHGTRATPRPSIDSTGTTGRSTPSRTWPRTARQERQVQSVAWLMAAAPGARSRPCATPRTSRVSGEPRAASSTSGRSASVCASGAGNRRARTA